jgi:hypothetical protein
VRAAAVTAGWDEPIGDDACRVTYTVDGEMRRGLGWLTPVIPRMGRRLVRTNLMSLGRRLDEAASAAANVRANAANRRAMGMSVILPIAPNFDPSRTPRGSRGNCFISDGITTHSNEAVNASDGRTGHRTKRHAGVAAASETRNVVSLRSANWKKRGAR